MAGLFGVIGGTVALALILAWRIRFRMWAGHSIDQSGIPAESARRSAKDNAPLPPSEFISAVERALGQDVVFLRLRTPSKVFKLEVPRRSG